MTSTALAAAHSPQADAVDPLPLTLPDGLEPGTIHDPESARLKVARLLAPHSLSVTGGRGAFAAHLASWDVGAVRLLDLEYGADVRLRRGLVEDCIAIVVPLTGVVRMRLAGATIVAQPRRTMVIVGNDQPMDISLSASTRVVIARLDRAALTGAAGILLPRVRPEPLRVTSAPLSCTEGFAIHGAIQAIARHVGRFGSAEAVPAGQSRLLAQQLLITTLLAVEHSCSARLHEPPASAAGARIQAAVRLVAAEQSGDRSVADLAAELGVSLRALELGFRRELGTTPHAYLRDSRLARVHEELARADGRRTTVSAIAGKWGFPHHGRFARAYRDRFGESPAETLRS